MLRQKIYSKPLRVKGVWDLGKGICGLGGGGAGGGRGWYPGPLKESVPDSESFVIGYPHTFSFTIASALIAFM